MTYIPFDPDVIAHSLRLVVLVDSGLLGTTTLHVVARIFPPANVERGFLCSDSFWGAWSLLERRFP